MYKKKVCEKMIQPVSAFSPRAVFRGSAKQSRKTSQERTKSQVALINAFGTSVAAGGLTTAVARSYTSSWAHAGILGVGGALLSMFFIAPWLVENTTLLKPIKKDGGNTISKESGRASATVKGALKPAAKKRVLFKQA